MEGQFNYCKNCMKYEYQIMLSTSLARCSSCGFEYGVEDDKTK
jgi:uncharacterized protein (DUF983 family)